MYISQNPDRLYLTSTPFGVPDELLELDEEDPEEELDDIDELELDDEEGITIYSVDQVHDPYTSELLL